MPAIVSGITKRMKKNLVRKDSKMRFLLTKLVMKKKKNKSEVTKSDTNVVRMYTEFI